MPDKRFHAKTQRRKERWTILILLLCVLASLRDLRSQEWPYYGGDQGGMKYSRLEQINLKTVEKLSAAWEWRTGEEPLSQYGTSPGTFQVTPLMIGNVLYLSTPYNRVVALDADTGRQLWAYDPKAYEDGQAPNGTGFVHRGVAAWRDSQDGNKLRIFINSRYRLISLDAETGLPVASFGKDGAVDLTEGARWPINRKHLTNTSPPVVYKDLVILGNGVADRLTYKNDPPGDVRAYDARTGNPVWTFHTVPMQGEAYLETWQDKSWSYTGHVNVWAPMSLDEERGLLFLPVSTPSNDFYGGRRPGANVYADSLVCLDAATGKRKWHFQTVHHGLWDYDPPSPPNVITVTVNGKKVDAVAQLTKQGFIFVFDRVTGRPVWPIAERRVPPSNMPGERAAASQPFPTRPPPLSPQGVTLDDALDVTPEIKAAAQTELKKYRLGPLYTPPSFEPMIMRPGIIGGANWGGGAFDPDTGILYVRTSNSASRIQVQKPPAGPQGETRGPDVDAEYVRAGSTSADFTLPGFKDPLPLLKPPYAHLTAVDMNKGEFVWRVPYGDNAALRSHPALNDVKLPDRLGVSGNSGALVTKGGLVFVAGGDTVLRAFDKTNGREVWQAPVPGRTNGTPMTYLSRRGKQFVVVAVGGGRNATLVAFAIVN